MKICFVPIDNRPVCYNLAIDIASIDRAITLVVPPRNILGDLKKTADINNLFNWLENIPDCDFYILALDTLVYGGLIPSRRGNESLDEIMTRILELKRILTAKKNSKIYAFSSIMRISNNNYNEEEKVYWSDYGKALFKYSYELHKNGYANSGEIPKDILEDYLGGRNRNFEVNKVFLEWQQSGILNTLIFSKDDCAEYGLNVREANELESLGGYIKTGADEIPLTLLSRAIEKEIKIFIQYTEPDCKNLISNYEDISVEKSVIGQLELGGFKVAKDEDEADIVLIVNNFREKQGELVMQWATQAYEGTFKIPDKPFAVADIRYANGADNNFVKTLLPYINSKNFCGYAGWNTTANTLGSLLSAVKVKFKANSYDEKAFKKLQAIRFLDDWAYQANIRGKLGTVCDISKEMKPYEEILSNILDFKINAKYTYPWNRKFETEINL